MPEFTKMKGKDIFLKVAKYSDIFSFLKCLLNFLRENDNHDRNIK